jgi:hypothetical protein
MLKKLRRWMDVQDAHFEQAEHRLSREARGLGAFYFEMQMNKIRGFTDRSTI